MSAQIFPSIGNAVGAWWSLVRLSVPADTVSGGNEDLVCFDGQAFRMVAHELPAAPRSPAGLCDPLVTWAVTSPRWGQVSRK
ncbi:hypothetical protein BM536_028940 [Streptomyces phaeoluteigriseus]|uniref:Uncharacterized protein n=1 Tax=Streptomyces phaeoluteigriseus TaxID=114686 RepID=A0A1V6MMD4_9ACTN|nr:hypothetical protein [Streptomyces phaeoluteigriseus]OQD53467.1 hypothetical protein BM536_028940 [Streptomyces phaeoluteigriseus]